MYISRKQYVENTHSSGERILSEFTSLKQKLTQLLHTKPEICCAVYINIYMRTID